jgi:hypothetical protein
MKKEILFLFVVFFLPLCIAFPFALPHAFFGIVTYQNGVPVNSGNIFAELNGEIVERGTIFNGTYGYHENFILASIEGGIIYFYFEGFNESVGNYEFEALGVTELNLIVNATPPINQTQLTSMSVSHRNNFVQFCDSNWKCSGWSECNNGIMTRSCKDTNNCGLQYNKPTVETGCELEKVLIEPEKGINYLFIFLGIGFALLIILIWVLFLI